MSGDFFSAHSLTPPPSRVGFVVVGLTLPIVLVALVIWFGAETYSIDATRGVVRDSFGRRLATTRLMLDLVSAEAAERAYLLTGDRSFVAPYGPARASLMMEMASLARAYADNPAQGRRMDQLRMLVEEKFRRMEQVMALRQTGGLAAAATLVENNKGRALMHQVRAVVVAINRAEDQSLTDAMAALRHEDQVSARLVWLLTLLGSLTLIVGLAMLWRGRQTRYELQRGMHEALVRLHAVFASTTDGIVIVDPEGRIEALNATANRMSGYHGTELEGTDIFRLIEVSGPRKPFHDRIGLVDGRLLHNSWLDRVLHTRDGGTVPVDIALGAMPLSDGVHVVGTIRDISERKAMERVKDDFIATVSHELRTPLTSVVGALGLLRGGSLGELPDAARRLVDIAENNSRRLIRLINDILDIEKIGTGQMHFQNEPVDLARIASRAIEGAHGLAEARQVELVRAVTMPVPMVRGDQERILQVMGNLLSNAIRYSPADGRVILSVGMQEDMAVIAIEDEGAGIAPEFEDRIFTRFAQAANSVGGGTGLGLAISRDIVEAHGGEIGFTRRPAGGTRFFFTLPLAPAQPDIDALPHQSRILLCEDDGEMAQVIRLLMEADGCVVDRVVTAGGAEIAAQSGRYDVIVLDLELSDASGLGALRALRARADTRRVPIIVVSASASDRMNDPAAAALDVIDWIDKPVDRARLMRSVRQAARRAAAGRPLLLHVDDDEDVLEVTATGLADQGRVIRATSLAAARAVLSREVVDVAILDLSLADGSGLDLVPELVDAKGHAIPTIIYSAQDAMPDMREKVDAVLVKSRRSLPNLASTIRRLLADVAA